MGVGHGADTFYHKVVDGFADKKRKIELIYKQILITNCRF